MNKLSEYFVAMGNTPDEVADWLRQRGIKGIRESHCHCPILNALYSEKHGGPAWSGLHIRAGRLQSDGHWYYHVKYDDSQICDPSLPQPVMDFIGRFDTGMYPDLEAKRVTEKTVRVVE